MAYNENPSYQLKNPSGSLVLIQKQTASSSSAISFTTGITGYDKYYLSFYGIIVSTTASMRLQVSTNGGSTWDSTHYSQFGYTANSGGLVNYGFNPGDVNGFEIASTSTATTTDSIAGNVEIYNLSSTTLWKQFISTCSYFFNAASTSDLRSSGYCQITTTVNAIQIIPTAGNFSVGTFKLYGIVN